MFSDDPRHWEEIGRPLNKGRSFGSSSGEDNGRQEELGLRGSSRTGERDVQTVFVVLLWIALLYIGTLASLLVVSMVILRQKLREYQNRGRFGY
jgi:hypothetical protein